MVSALARLFPFHPSGSHGQLYKAVTYYILLKDGINLQLFQITFHISGTSSFPERKYIISSWYFTYLGLKYARHFHV